MGHSVLIDSELLNRFISGQPTHPAGQGHGGVTTNGPDATHPPTIFQNSGGGGAVGVGGPAGGRGGVPPGGQGGSSRRGSGGGLAGRHGGVQPGVRARVRVRARVVVAVRACSPPVALLQVKMFS